MDTEDGRGRKASGGEERREREEQCLSHFADHKRHDLAIREINGSSSFVLGFDAGLG
jgi:hypothetical protein